MYAGETVERALCQLKSLVIEVTSDKEVTRRVFDRLARTGRQTFSNVCGVVHLKIRPLTNARNLCRRTRSALNETHISRTNVDSVSSGSCFTLRCTENNCLCHGFNQR